MQPFVFPLRHTRHFSVLSLAGPDRRSCGAHLRGQWASSSTKTVRSVSTETAPSLQNREDLTVGTGHKLNKNNNKKPKGTDLHQKARMKTDLGVFMLFWQEEKIKNYPSVGPETAGTMTASLSESEGTKLEINLNQVCTSHLVKLN